MKIKAFLLLLSYSLFASPVLSEEPSSPEQAAIDQFNACVETALGNGAAAAQVLTVCKNEKAVLDEKIPHLSEQILFFLAGDQ